MNDFDPEDEELERALAVSRDEEEAELQRALQWSMQETAQASLVLTDDDVTSSVLLESLSSARQQQQQHQQQEQEQMSEEELIAQATAMSLAEVQVQTQQYTPMDKDNVDEDLLRAITLSLQESLTSPPPSAPSLELESPNAALDLSQYQDFELAMSRNETSSSAEYEQKVENMMNAAGPLANGRLRQCLEVQKNTGKFIVGKCNI